MTPTTKKATMTPAQLREALASLGWTQRHAAQRAGLHPTAGRITINRYVNGSSPIPGPLAAFIRLELERRDLARAIKDDNVSRETLRDMVAA